MRLWWLSLSLLMVVPLLKTSRTPNRTQCQEILCQDWALLQSVLKKNGFICRCFIVKCVYIAEVRRINHMPCTWIYRGHHKEKITSAILKPKIIRSLLRGKKHSSKQDITLKTCLIIGLFHVKRQAATKLDKQPSEDPIYWTSDHHSCQITDGFPGDAFKEAPERCLWNQVSELAKMLRNTFPSATKLKIFTNRKGLTICPINQATRYSQQHQGAEIEINELEESAMKFVSNSSNDAVIHMEKILLLLGMGLFPMTAKDSIVTPTTVIIDDEFNVGDDKMTSTMSFSQTITKPHNVEVTESFEIESTKDLLKTEDPIMNTSELENPATSRKYANTVALAKQQMGITKVQTKRDCTTELEMPSAENEGSEKKISSGSKEIRPTVEAVQETTKHGQKHQTSFSGITLTLAKATAENPVYDINHKDEQREDLTAKEKLILVTSQPDILMTKEPQTNNPVTPTTSRGNKHTAVLTEKETGMTTELPESECKTEIEQTLEDKKHVERTDTSYGERESKYDRLPSEHFKTESINELVTSAPSRGYEHTTIVTDHEEEMTTEAHETQCTTEIEILTSEDKTPLITTAATHEERHSEPVDFISENIGSNKLTATVSTKYAEVLISTRQETLLTTVTLETECTTEIEIQTPEDKTPVMTTAVTHEESIQSKGTNEPVTATISTKYAKDLISTRQQTLMKTELHETKHITEIELQTPEDKTPVMTTAIKHEERHSEPINLNSENIQSKGTNKPVTPTISTEYADFISTRQETLLTTEALETECTTEIELQTADDKTPVMTTATTHEERHSEPADFTSEKIESKATTEPLKPTISTKYAEDFTENREETLITTESLETECTTEVELQTQEIKTPVMTTASTYEEQHSEPIDFISENIESKGTNEPVTPTISTKYAEDLISTRQETLMTIEILETKHITEIELQTQEDKTPVMTTATTHEERHSEPINLISENIQSKGTNKPVTPTISTEYADFISTRQETLLTTEALETERITEIELLTPEDKTPVITKAATYEERHSEPADFVSENIKSKATNEALTTTVSEIKAEYLTKNREETLITTETLETECTTEIELQTPEDKTPMERTDVTHEERQPKPADFISDKIETKDTNELVTPNPYRKFAEDFTVTRQEILMTTETLETECTTEIEILTPEDKTTPNQETEGSQSTDEDGCFGLIHRTSSGLKRCQEKMMKMNVLMSDHLATEGTNTLITATTSRKHAKDIIKTEKKILMTTETLETECTTEIELQTPEDKTHVEGSDTTHEERQSEYNGLRSEHLATKGMNELVASAPSRAHEHTVIVTKQELEMTTELPETECTTEIEILTPEDKTTPNQETEGSQSTDEDGCFGFIHRTSSGLKRCQEKMMKLNDVKSDHLATEGTNTLITATTSRKLTEDLIMTEKEKIMTTETLEKECTTEIELQTPEDKTPMERTDITHEERQPKPADFISDKIETKDTNELVTPNPSRKSAEDFTVTRQEILMTTETLETECTTEIEIQTPEDKTPVERTDITHEERQSEYNGLSSEHLATKGTNELVVSTSSRAHEHTVIVTKQELEMTTELPETECTTEIEIQTPEDKTTPNQETEGSQSTDEDGCFGLIHRTSSGLKRCQEKMMKMNDVKSDHLATEGTNTLITATTSRKLTEDIIMTEKEKIMTTETIETECTTEIEIETPEDKTPVERTDITDEERQSEYNGLSSELLATKGMNELVVSTPSSTHEHTVIVTKQEIEMTTELPETECTTEIEILTPEDKTTPNQETEGSQSTDEDGCFGLIHRTSSGLKRCQEKMMKINDLKSDHLATESNTLITTTKSRKFTEDLIMTEKEKIMTTETLETECTTEIELQTPEDKTHVERTDITHEERQPKPADFISDKIETKDTNELVTPNPSRKSAEDFTVTRQEILMTTETLETECTTEIEIQTPEDKTPVERTDITDEERQSEYNGLHSEHLATKGMNELVVSTPSSTHEHTVIVTKQELEMTTELPETECTTEIEILTPEDKTTPNQETEGSQSTDEDGCFGLIHRTSSGLKRCQEKMMKINDLMSDHLATEGTNTLITATKSRKLTEDLIITEKEILMTTETLETECTTEIELQTPEDKTPVERTDVTLEERQPKPADFISDKIETKDTNELVTPNPSRKSAEDFTVTRQEILMTTETLETECTTEIEIQTPEDKTPVERTDITDEERQSEYNGLSSEYLATKGMNELVVSTPSSTHEHTVIVTKQEIEMTTELPETECTTEIEILTPEDKTTPNQETEGSQSTDEDGCFGLIHRTSSGLKRCQEKMIRIMPYNTTPKPQEFSTVKHKQETADLSFILQNALQPSPQSAKQITQNNMDKVAEDENSHFYYFNGKLKRVENHALGLEYENNTYTNQTMGQS